MSTVQRRRRSARSSVGELTPGEIVALMSGCFCTSGLPADEQDRRACDLPSAFDLFVARRPEDMGTPRDPLVRLWDSHGDALTEEADAYGFRPYFALQHSAPWTAAEREAERRWRNAFFARERNGTITC